MGRDVTDNDEANDVESDSSVDSMYLVDQLEELINTSKRLPFSTRILVEESELLYLIDQLRTTIPREISQAQRVIKDREILIDRAQQEAAQILHEARERAAYLASNEGIYNEAKQMSEEQLRTSKEKVSRYSGEFEIHMLELLDRVQDAVRRSSEMMQIAVEETMDTIEGAKDRIAK